MDGSGRREIKIKMWRERERWVLEKKKPEKQIFCVLKNWVVFVFEFLKMDL